MSVSLSQFPSSQVRQFRKITIFFRMRFWVHCFGADFFSAVEKYPSSLIAKCIHSFRSYWRLFPAESPRKIRFDCFYELAFSIVRMYDWYLVQRLRQKRQTFSHSTVQNRSKIFIGMGSGFNFYVFITCLYPQHTPSLLLSPGVPAIVTFTNNLQVSFLQSHSIQKATVTATLSFPAHQLLDLHVHLLPNVIFRTSRENHYRFYNK